MERSEQAALGVAAIGHAALFALLSASFLQPRPAFTPSPPMSISLVDDVALAAAAPAAVEPPAPSVAPETGPPEDAAAAAPAPPAPDPAPPAPQPKAAPPAAAALAKPLPKQTAAPTPDHAKALPKPAATTAAKPVPKAPARGAGTQLAAAQTRPRGAILGEDFLKGIVADRAKTDAKGQTPLAAMMDGKARADIASAIIRQVQPCADRQVIPGPGAEKIRVTMRLGINRDGSLAARPQVIGHDGVGDGNSRYVDRVDDLAIATFVGCAPLRGLPADLYAVPGGWRLFTLRYKLPG